MATTIGHPADPVTNGATEIQSTTFNGVLADYSPLTWGSAQRIIAGKEHPVRRFPKGAEDPTWAFYGRVDLAGANAALRNIIGVHVVQTSQQQKGVSASAGNVTLAVLEFYVEVINWYPEVLTTDNLGTVVRFKPYSASMGLTADPAGTGTLLYGDGTHRALDEAVGFILRRNAASVPTFEPLLNAIGGVHPLTS